LFSPATARAEEPDPQAVRARNHLQSGVAYYDEGRYDEAAREMEAAYHLKPLPDLQYNLAQCYERLGRFDEAAKAYRAYLDGKPAADDRAQVEERVKNLQLRSAPPSPTNPGAPPPKALPEKVVFKTIVVYREPPPPPGRGARIAAVALVAVFGVAAASGITFAVLAKQHADMVSSDANPTMPPMFNGPDSAAQDNARQDVILAWVSAGVAVAAAAGAVGLFLLGRKIDRESPELTLAPGFAPGGAGLALAGRF
jgi:tetratricopeptide (TPR) repeat protein